MAEWLKAAVLKTAVFHDTVGSNPTPSARLNNQSKRELEIIIRYPAFSDEIRRDGRVDEGVRLLSECRAKSFTEGSNPSLSASLSDNTIQI